MNYFAHARPFLLAGNPCHYFLAGTATPDWLNVVARRTKCRSRHAEPFVNHRDVHTSQLARGIVQHHADDRSFHGNRAFVELTLTFSKRIHFALGESTDLRAGFLGHILVELLLDDVLIAADHRILDDYYIALDDVDPREIANCVELMCGRPVPELAQLIPRFIDERFLYDYHDDTRLCLRLNQVLNRVRLPPLPARFKSLLPDARNDVLERVAELLPGQRTVQDIYRIC